MFEGSINLVMAIVVLVIIISMIRRRNPKCSVGVPRSKTSRVKHKQQSLVDSVNELTRKVDNLRQNRLTPDIDNMDRLCESLRKLKTMQTKVHLLYLDESQQCKRAIMYLEGSDKHDENRPVIVKNAVSASDSDVKTARTLRSRIVKSHQRSMDCWSQQQRSVACGPCVTPDLTHTIVDDWIRLKVAVIVHHLDLVWNVVVTCSEVFLKRDGFTSCWNTLKRVIAINVISVNDEITVIVDFFVPAECGPEKVPAKGWLWDIR